MERPDPGSGSAVGLSDRLTAHAACVVADSETFLWDFVELLAAYMGEQIAKVRGLDPALEREQSRINPDKSARHGLNLVFNGWEPPAYYMDVSSIPLERIGFSPPWPGWVRDFMCLDAPSSPKRELWVRDSAAFHGFVKCMLQGITQCLVAIDGSGGMTLRAHGHPLPGPGHPDWLHAIHIIRVGYGVLMHAASCIKQIGQGVKPAPPEPVEYPVAEPDLSPSDRLARLTAWAYHADWIVSQIHALTEGTPELNYTNHITVLGRVAANPDLGRGWAYMEVRFNTAPPPLPARPMVDLCRRRARNLALTAKDGVFTLRYTNAA